MDEKEQKEAFSEDMVENIEGNIVGAASNEYGFEKTGLCDCETSDDESEQTDELSEVDEMKQTNELNEADELSEAEEAEEKQDKQDKQGFVQEKPEMTDEELDRIADIAIDTLRGILAFFDAGDSAIDEYEGDEGELILDVIGEDLAVLIGRYGKTLDALQYLVSSIVNRKIGYHYPIAIDIEGYRNRRRQKLEALAKSAAARCIRNKKEVRLRPMTPYERRIVHIILRDEARVETVSEGEDPQRQIVVKPT